MHRLGNGVAVALCFGLFLATAGCAGDSPGDDAGTDGSDGSDGSGDANCTCNDGPCCDGCHYFTQSEQHVCETLHEYTCEASTCGANVMTRSAVKICTGGTSECSGQIGEWSDWTIDHSCDSDQICQPDGSGPVCTTCEHGCGGPEDTCYPECDPAEPCCNTDGTFGSFDLSHQCPPDQGCSGGACVPACQAAEDAHRHVGCHFIVATPHIVKTIDPPCFAIFVTNNWHKEAEIMVTRGVDSFDVTDFGKIPTADPEPNNWPAVPDTGLPSGEVAVLFLSHDPASNSAGTPLTCPVPPAVSAPGGSAVEGTGIGQAWEINTNVPVGIHDILPYGGASSFVPGAALLAPTSQWGRNSIAVVPPDSSGENWGQLVARNDNTTVSIMPSVTLPSGDGLIEAPANQVTEFSLQSGQYIQWELPEDMTGSVILSGEFFAFNGGNGYLCAASSTSTGGGCDAAHQQVPRITALASEYVAPPYASRGSQPESILYLLVGAVDGTMLAYDPPVSGAPGVIHSGQSMVFETPLAFTVVSQDEDHPFYLGQIMTGAHVTGNDGNIGDEEFVIIPPPAQYQRTYFFYTDVSYHTTNLVLVRTVTPNGFKEVTVDCLGAIEGWVDVGGGGKYQVTNVDLIREGVGNGDCQNGKHTATSEAPFGLIVWGLDSYTSYSYPAGSGFSTINTVEVPVLP